MHPPGIKQSKILDISELKIAHLDALQEISNIGIGTAATSLSKLVGATVDISVPKVSLADAADLAAHISTSGEPHIGLSLKMLGAAAGEMLLTLPKESAVYLLTILLKRETANDDLYSEMAVSALKEVGNILASAYLSSVGEITGINLVPSMLDLSYDISSTTGHMRDLSIYNTMLVIETEFFIRGHRISGKLFLFLNAESINVLLSRLGQM